MNINAVGAPPNPYRPQEKERPDTDHDAVKLDAEIEKSQEELAKLARQFQQHVAKGEQDMANLKNAEMQTKQMDLQTIRNQQKTQEPPKAQASAQDNRPKFDTYVGAAEDPVKQPHLTYQLQVEDGNQVVYFGPTAAGAAEKADVLSAEEKEESDPVLEQLKEKVNSKGDKKTEKPENEIIWWETVIESDPSDPDNPDKARVISSRQVNGPAGSPV